MSIQAFTDSYPKPYLPKSQPEAKTSPTTENLTNHSVADLIKQIATRPRPEILYQLPQNPRRCSIIPSFIKNAVSSIVQALSKKAAPTFLLTDPRFCMSSDLLGSQRWDYSITKFNQIGNTLALTFKHDGPEDAPIVFKCDPEWGISRTLKKRTYSIHVDKQEGTVKANQPTHVATLLDLPGSGTRAIYSFVDSNGDVAGNFISRPKIQDQVFNPDLYLINPCNEVMRYSWDCTIKEMDYDLKANTVTIDIEHNGPENTEIVLHCDPSWLKTSPPQKQLFIHLPKPAHAEASTILRKTRVVIDFKNPKYFESLTSHGAFTVRFNDSHRSDRRIFFRDETTSYLDKEEKAWANVIAIQ
jgi:hypothetical protein